MTRIFLTVVGVAYLVLSAWCSVDPEKTSQAVGFNLHPGTGQSEYLVIYGGLEAALAVIFLLPLLRKEQTLFSLQACLIVHAFLVIFRSIGFVTFTGIETKTYVLATVEWTILLGALILWVRHK